MHLQCAIENLHKRSSDIEHYYNLIGKIQTTDSNLLTKSVCFQIYISNLRVYQTSSMQIYLSDTP